MVKKIMWAKWFTTVLTIGENDNYLNCEPVQCSWRHLHIHSIFCTYVAGRKNPSRLTLSYFLIVIRGKGHMEKIPDCVPRFVWLVWTEDFDTWDMDNWTRVISSCNKRIFRQKIEGGTLIRFFIFMMKLFAWILFSPIMYHNVPQK